MKKTKYVVGAVIVLAVAALGAARIGGKNKAEQEGESILVVGADNDGDAGEGQPVNDDGETNESNNATPGSDLSNNGNESDNHLGINLGNGGSDSNVTIHTIGGQSVAIVEGNPGGVDDSHTEGSINDNISYEDLELVDYEGPSQEMRDEANDLTAAIFSGNKIEEAPVTEMSAGEEGR